MVEPAATRQLHMGAHGQMGDSNRREVQLSKGEVGIDGLVVVIYLHSHL